jgi:hypothetical protein
MKKNEVSKLHCIWTVCQNYLQKMRTISKGIMIFRKWITTVNNSRNLAINPFLSISGHIWPEWLKYPIFNFFFWRQHNVNFCSLLWSYTASAPPRRLPACWIPDWGIESTPVSGCRTGPPRQPSLSGQYDNTMPELTLSPQSGIYEFGYWDQTSLLSRWIS